jgi:hypothetical protein
MRRGVEGAVRGTLDHRGKPVTPCEWTRLPRGFSSRLALAASASGDWIPVGSIAMGLVIIGAYVLVGFVWNEPVNGVQRADIDGILLAVLAVGVGFVALGPATYFGRGFIFSRTAAVFLREGLCPSCVYPLKDISPQQDGCTVCPECGAAWKM